MFEEGIRHEIYDSMNLKTTQELQQIWQEQDKEEWTEEAFEIVKQILMQRTGEIPSQPDTSHPFPEEWVKIEWGKILEKQRSLKYKSTIILTIVGLVFFLVFAFVSFRIYFDSGIIFNSISEKITSVVILLVIGLAFFGFFVILSNISQKKKFIVKGKINIKSEPQSRSGHSTLQLTVYNAYEISPDGQLNEWSKWKGHQYFDAYNPLSYKLEEGEIYDLLCFSNAQIWGLLEDYIG